MKLYIQLVNIFTVIQDFVHFYPSTNYVIRPLVLQCVLFLRDLVLHIVKSYINSDNSQASSIASFRE